MKKQKRRSKKSSAKAQDINEKNIAEKYFEVNSPSNEVVASIVKKILPRVFAVIEDVDSEISSEDYGLLSISGAYEYSMTGLITRLLFDENLLKKIFKPEHVKKLLSKKDEYINGKFAPCSFLDFDENGFALDDGKKYEEYGNDYTHPSYEMYEEIINSTITLAAFKLLKDGLLDESCDDYDEWDEYHIQYIKELFVDEDSFNEYFDL
jgi:hypothetical protein